MIIFIAFSRKIARAVIATRPLSRTSQLSDAIASVVPRMEVYKSQESIVLQVVVVVVVVTLDLVIVILTHPYTL